MIKAYGVSGKGTGNRKGVRGAACLLLAGGLFLGEGVAKADVPTAAQMLAFRPRQAGVACTTPDADKTASCKVDWVRDTPRGGWTLTLKDETGNLLRRFVDTNGDNRPDVWSYYKDGAEVYREIDTALDGGKPNQYRWLNAGGMKWGLDQNKDGKIEYWKAISPEEVSQEVLQAVLTRDFTRLQTLMISEAEIKALGLPAEEANRIREVQKGAAAKFQDTCSKLSKLGPKTNWLHLETAAPQCLPADQTGSRQDLVKHARGTLLYENGGSSDGIQTGEMIQVGVAWRLVDAPVPGATIIDPNGGGPAGTASEDPRVTKLIEELAELDKQAPKPATDIGVDRPVAEFNLRRADQLEKIVGAVKPQERDPWLRQLADTLSTAAQKSPANETAAYDRLVSLEKQLAAAMPGSALVGYVTFRELQADYTVRTQGKSNDANKTQDYYLGRLAKFVGDYPKAEDAADALLQLGMTNEILNKEVEAKNWYNKLKQSFPDKPQAAKAAGALRRLEMEGKPFKLSGPLLTDPNTAYDIGQAHGKVVVVYYWASWSPQAAGEFAKLKQLLADYGAKGLELVCVNLDATAEEGRKYLSSSSLPGTHLYQSGGLEGKLAIDYGIQALPSMFLVGKDGKVLSRNAQVGTLEDEIKKQLK